MEGPRSGAPGPAPPRYRGARGAVAYGLLLLGVGLVFGTVAGVVLYLRTGNTALALELAARVGLFGGAAGVAAGLARWVCGGATDRLLSLRLVKGDLGAIAGLVLGLFVVGSLADEERAD